MNWYEKLPDNYGCCWKSCNVHCCVAFNFYLPMKKPKKDSYIVTRFEVIDHSRTVEEGGGRAFVLREKSLEVELSFQDDNKTLKVFITKK